MVYSSDCNRRSSTIFENTSIMLPVDRQNDNFLSGLINVACIPMKLVRLIKMCLNKTYCRVRVYKYLSDMFPISYVLKQGDALAPLLFNFALDYAIRRVQVNQDCLKFNGTHQLLVYADVNILSGSVHTVKKNTHCNFVIR